MERRTGLILDVETTGLSEKDELIEFAAVLFSFNPRSGEIEGILEEYQDLREPKCRISSGAKKVHNIEEHQVRGKSLDTVKISGLLEKADIILAHNASFDYRFVTALFPRAKGKNWVCTMRGYPWTRKGFPSRKLDDLLNVAGINRERSHRALDDSRALLELVSRREKTSGKTYLQEILDSPAASLWNKGRTGAMRV